MTVNNPEGPKPSEEISNRLAGMVLDGGNEMHERLNALENRWLQANKRQSATIDRLMLQRSQILAALNADDKEPEEILDEIRVIMAGEDG